MFRDRVACTASIVSVRERVCQQLMVNDITERYSLEDWLEDPDFQVSLDASEEFGLVERLSGSFIMVVFRFSWLCHTSPPPPPQTHTNVG